MPNIINNGVCQLMSEYTLFGQDGFVPKYRPIHSIIMNISEHLLYTAQHLWLECQSDGTLLAGSIAHAQETPGDIVYVSVPMNGAPLSAGSLCGIVESVKTTSDLRTPVTEMIKEINPRIQAAPEDISETLTPPRFFRVRPILGQWSDRTAGCGRLPTSTGSELTSLLH